MQSKATLHFNEWGGGGCGIANAYLSLQIAYILARLSHRKLIFYRERHLGHSNTQTYLNDLFECKNIDCVDGVIPSDIFSFPLEQKVFCYDEVPTENFLNGRDFIDLKTFTQNDIAGFGYLLSYYSFSVYFQRRRKEIIDSMRVDLSPKEKYIKIAKKISQIFGPYHSYHLRLGDFRTFSGGQFLHTTEDIKFILENYLAGNTILVHTNEETSLKDSSIILIDKKIAEIVPSLSTIEIALVSLLIATYSVKFTGTYGSTFTGLVNQMRYLNGFTEPFFYINQNCVVKEYSWNKLGLTHGPMNFAREFEDCGY